MSTTKTLSEIINQPIPGTVKKLADTPEYTSMQEAKTDMRLAQIVSMLHEIKGELSDIRDMLLCSHSEKKD